MTNVIKSDEGWERLRVKRERGLARPGFRRFRDHRPKKTAMTTAVPKAIAAAQKVVTTVEGDEVVRRGRRLRRVVIG